MKKFLLIVLILFTTTLTSCGYKEYSGNHSDLYSVAINSILWLNGFSWGADYKCDPKIEIIDEDYYGRTMFTYYEKYYKGANVSFSALVVCQGSNDKEVLYYEDINYIVKKQVLYSQNLEKFSEEEIEHLKLINDWNKEINYDKCIRKEKIKSKLKITNEKEIKNIIINQFKLVNGEFSLFMDFLTTNSDGTKYIIYGYIRKSEYEGMYFIGLAEKDDVTTLNIIVTSNVYDYKTEVIEFKEKNSWY